jgi:glycosidase
MQQDSLFIAAVLASAVFTGIGLEACAPTASAPGPNSSPLFHREDSAPATGAVYQIFVRSFRDSDGDGVGDLAGIVEGLDHIQSLGAETIMLTPIYPSPFYHNYFADSFYGIDPEYGDMADAADLIAAVHARGMKIYLDQEIHYVSENHDWYTRSLGDPDGVYGDYVVYLDDNNTRPAGGFLGLNALPVYQGGTISHFTANLLNPDVQAYFADFLMSWVDPDGDGDTSDGVDGFRIDHMMDDLDNAGHLTNLFDEFWAPLFAEIRAANPDFHIVAEQWDWGYGEDFIARANVDSVFAFPLAVALRDLDAGAAAEAINTMSAFAPGLHQQHVFVEKHDLDRLASSLGDDARRFEASTALGLLAGWTPLVYAGQELGMRGLKGDYGTDANDILIREAVRWDADLETSGSAIWYRDVAEVWAARFNRSGDGVSVEEQTGVAGSALEHHRDVLHLRARHPALLRGRSSAHAADGQLRITRTAPGGEEMIIHANLSDASVEAECAGELTVAANRSQRGVRCEAGRMNLAPYQVVVMQP